MGFNGSFNSFKDITAFQSVGEAAFSTSETPGSVGEDSIWASGRDYKTTHPNTRRRKPAGWWYAGPYSEDPIDKNSITSQPSRRRILCDREACWTIWRLIKGGYIEYKSSIRSTILPFRNEASKLAVRYHCIRNRIKEGDIELGYNKHSRNDSWRPH